MDEKIVFKETQKFRQWWLWLLMFLPIFILLFQFLFPLFQGIENNSGNFSFSLVMPYTYWVGFIIWFLTILFIWRSKLKIIITKDKIEVRHLLFFKKTIDIKRIINTELINYSFVGYGVRISSKYGTVYNVKGNTGLAIILDNRKKYLIGTQKPEELKAVLKEILE